MSTYILSDHVLTCATFTPAFPQNPICCGSPLVTHVTTSDPSILDDYASGLDVYIPLSAIGHYYCAEHAPIDAIPVTIINGCRIKTMIKRMVCKELDCDATIIKMILRDCHLFEQ